MNEECRGHFLQAARPYAQKICPNTHLLLNQGYPGVIHLHCHADTYTDNKFDNDNYQQDEPTVSGGDESTPTAVLLLLALPGHACMLVCMCVYLQLSYQLCLSL